MDVLFLGGDKRDRTADLLNAILMMLGKQWYTMDIMTHFDAFVV